MARQKQAKKGIQKARAKKRVGFLNSASLNELDRPVAAFHRGMRQLGFVEGKNVEITYQWAKHDLARLPDMARKLVDAGVDVIAATGGIACAQAAVDGMDPPQSRHESSSWAPSTHINSHDQAAMRRA